MTKIGTVYTLGIWMVKPGKEAAFIKAWDNFALWTSMNQQGAQNAVLVQDFRKSPKIHLIRAVAGQGNCHTVAKHS